MSEPLSADFVNDLVAADGLALATENRTILTPSRLSMKDSAAAISAVKKCAEEHPNQPKQPSQQEVTVSGTGFFVASGFVITNNHVVEECTKPIEVRYPEGSSDTATISGRDETNDLALLHTGMNASAIASFGSRGKLGQQIAAYGFPYSGILSSGGNFALGNITSLSGIKDDTRFLQTSEPTQPGNSGGPLLDMSGRVIGVVVAQLDAMTMMAGGGNVPQNVNFAIQGSPHDLLKTAR